MVNPSRRLRTRRAFVTCVALALVILAILPAAARSKADTCFGEVATHTGTAGNDTIVGTPNDDVIIGGDGDDVLKGKGGNDKICGGDGNDTLLGGQGDDELSGGPGDDTLEGQSGDDKLLGNGGSDWLYGGEGDDILKGGTGDDVLIGTPGFDKDYGGGGWDDCDLADDVRRKCEDSGDVILAAAVIAEGGHIEGAGAYPGGPVPHPIVLIQPDGDVHSINDKVPGNWKPVSIRRIQLVAIIGAQQRVAIQTCLYNGPDIVRYQYTKTVKLYKAATGDAVANTTLRGTAPRQCQLTESYWTTQLLGGAVTDTQIIDWLSGYVEG